MDDETLPKDVEERLAEADAPMEVELHEDKTREMKTPGFSRFQTDWDGPHGEVVKTIHAVIDNRILVDFADAFVILNDLFEVVREPVVDLDTGEVLKDQHGWPIWQRDKHGHYIENYGNLSIRQREDLMHKITTHLVEWEQKAQAKWFEAMLAKALYEEEFANLFVAGEGRQTDALRENRARTGASQQRVFGIVQSYYSRKADALVRSMILVGQRIKDTTV